MNNMNKGMSRERRGKHCRADVDLSCRIETRFDVSMYEVCFSDKCDR